ncbi:MAG TPA: energy transducer TonB [Gemmatimonadaceae bacterium]
MPAAPDRRNGWARLRAVAWLLAVASSAGCAVNQKVPARVAAARAPGDTVGCLDTLRTTDSVTAIIKAVVLPRDTSTELPLDFENMFAEEFRARFKVPPKMSLSVVKGAPPCDSVGSRCAAGILDVGAFAYATAHSDGKLSDIVVLDIALTPAFADSVKSVLESISSESLGPPTGGADSIPLILQLQREDSPDTVPAYRQILKVRLPRYDLPFTYAMMPASGVEPRYPYTGRLAGVGDSVTVAYTVQSDGSIVAESIELVKASYSDFVSSVADALLSTRYHPARIGDCAVATRMEQRFLFRLPE